MLQTILNYGSWYRLIASGRIRRCNPGTIKEFSIEFLTNRSSESRSTQNLNFSLTAIKSKPISRYEPVSRFEQSQSAHFINRNRILAHTSIKVKLPSTFINSSRLRSTQNLNYNSQLNKSKVGISRTFSSTYLTSTNRKASIAQTTIKVKAARVSPGSL